MYLKSVALLALLGFSLAVNAAEPPQVGPFATGQLNTVTNKFFSGKSYLQSLNSQEVRVSNVTFEPGCRNNWHIRHKSGQILLVTGGEGFYQEWGKPAQRLKAGDSVYIAPGVKHWHGATAKSCFAHVALNVPVEGSRAEWLEPVSDADYAKIQ